MERPSAAALVGLALSAGCFPGCVPRKSSADLTSDVAYVAALDALTVSPLLRVTEGGSVPFTVSSSVTLYGWTREQIASLLPPDDEKLRTIPLLHKVFPCDPELPAPIYARVINEERELVFVDPPKASMLTADWIGCPNPTAEPTVVDTYRAEVRSAPLFRTTETTVNGCRTSMVVEECEPVLTGRIAPDGRACFTGPGCMEQRYDHESTHYSTVHCTAPMRGCNIDLHDTTLVDPFPYASCEEGDPSCRAQYFDPANARGPRLSDHAPMSLDNSYLKWGFGEDLALFEDHAVVVYRDGQNDNYCPPAGVESYLVSLDLESLEVSTPTVTYPCTVKIARTGRRLLTATATFPPRVSLLDEHGTTITSTTIDWGANTPLMTGLVHLATSSVAIVSFIEANEYVHAMLVALKEPELKEVARVEFDGLPVSIVQSDTNQVLLADDRADSAVWIDFLGDHFEFAKEAPEFATGANFADATYSPAYRAAVISTISINPSLHLNRIDIHLSAAVSFMVRGAPTSALEIPTTPPSIAAAIYSPAMDGTSTLYLSIAHVTDELRFEARAVKVGRGIGTRLQLDMKQRLWMLVPWSGEVVRLSPSW